MVTFERPGLVQGTIEVSVVRLESPMQVNRLRPDQQAAMVW